MKLRTYLYKIVFGITALVSIYACNDSFLDRFPETQITEKLYFKSVKDLETYTNGMYGWLGTDYWDVPSDNVIYSEDNNLYSKMRGEVNPNNTGSWANSWSSIRSVNFMLARIGTVKGNINEINHYIGLARMFRAYLYYNLVKTYSDVPWYNTDLKTADKELLYKAQDPRQLVVDSIMADLDFATKNMLDKNNKTIISRDVALSLQARIALNEGTFRKYHSELGLTDGDRFLEIAAKTAKVIIDSKKYTLSEVQENGLKAYESLFCSLDLTKNTEMILVGDYDKNLGRMHNAQCVFDWGTGLSRDLMEDYLVINGNKTMSFQSVPNYDKKSILEIFENRDPRLEQTFMRPGYIRVTSTTAYRAKQTLGGYVQKKFDPKTYDQIQWGKSYTDLPIIRYAEILLIYAEAKAEMGLLTQDDIDLSINLIRRRAGVPNVILSEWLTKIDPIQAQRYDNVQSSQKGAVLEIRRERRIELACEGFRYNDLMRWKKGKLLEKAPEGSYYPGYGLYDITGDGQPDIAIVKDKAAAEEIPNTEKEKYKLNVYILEGNTIELSHKDEGYIRLVSQVNKWNFEEPKYYYQPISQRDINLNENLYQNEFWK